MECRSQTYDSLMMHNRITVKIKVQSRFATAQTGAFLFNRADNVSQKRLHASLVSEGYRFPAHLLVKENAIKSCFISVSAPL